MHTHSATRTLALDIETLLLLSILLAAGFILNLTVGKALSAISGGTIAPEFIIASMCTAILLSSPGPKQALIIGAISAAVIQITTTSPGIDFVAEPIAALAMVAVVRLCALGRCTRIAAPLGTALATLVSGSIFALIKMLITGFATQIFFIMMPVVIITALCNAMIVELSYPQVRATLRPRRTA